MSNKYINLFEKGEFYRCLFGDKSFYIFDKLNGGHAIEAAIHWYVRWDKAWKKKNTESLKAALERAFKENKESDGYWTLMPIKAVKEFLYQEQKYNIELGVSNSFFEKILEKYLPLYTKEEWEKHHIQRDIDWFKEKAGLELYIKPPS